MKKILPGLLLIFLLGSFQNLNSQTSFYDDFNTELDETIWVEKPGYTLSIVDGELLIDVEKKDPLESFRISFEDAPIDISDHPVINFDIMASKAMQLRFGINVGVNYFTIVSIPEADNMVNVSIDLTDAPDKHDLTKLRYIDVYVNRYAMSYNGDIYIDDFRIAGDAVMHANLGAIPDQVVYAGEDDVKLIVKDIQNASSITASGAEDFIENLRVSPVVQSTFSNIAYVTFDVKEGVEGQGQLTLTAQGIEGYADNSFVADLSVVINNPPEVDVPEDVELETGKVFMFDITGISDGDADADQDLEITATSSDQSVIRDEDINISYRTGSPYGTISLEPVMAGTSTITLTLNDNESVNNITEVSFVAEVFDNLNLPPTINPVEDAQVPYFDGSESLITLTGISDGNGDTQTLTFSVTSSDQSVVEDASLSITDYDPATGTAILHYTPVGEGEATLTVTVADDGAGTDNEAKQVSTDILVQPVTLYPRGLGWELAKDPERWSGDSGIEVQATTFDGSEVLEVSANDKWIWGALNFSFSDTSLNLTEDPYVSLEIYSPDENTLHWLWFYDDYELTGDEAHRNDFPDVTHDEGKAVWVPAGEWTTVTFDFSGENEMSRNVNDEPVPINAKRIVRILYNFHNKENVWPRPAPWTGKFYIRNFRVGDSAVVPDPFATIDPVPDQVFFENPGAQTLTVTGLSDGRGGLPEVSLESLNTGWVDPSLSAVQPDGTMDINFTPGTGSNEAEVVLTVSATDAQTVTDTFLIKTVARDPGTAAGVTIDMTERYQEMRGIGTYMNQYFDLYTNEMGATAMRVGIISNQIEPVNDNSDPYVLNRSALDYSAFDWDAMRRMKESGVETFILTSWSAPGWMKDNYSENWFEANVTPWEEALNRTSPFFYEEWAEYFVAAYRMFEEEAGIKLDGIGIQNEPAFYEPYPSAILSPAEFAKMVVVLGKRLELEGIDGVKIYMPEQVFSQSHYSMNEYMEAVNNHPEADKYTDVIATHGYASDGIGSGAPDFSAWTAMYEKAQEGSRTRELWMTETHRGYSSYDDAMWIAMAMYGAFEYGNVNLWTQWGITGQHIVDGKPTQMLYTVGNFARFIKPGAVRVKSTAAGDNLYSSAWVDEERGELVTVLINDSNEPISTYLTGSGIPGTYHTYLTTAIRGLDDMGMSTDSLVVLPPKSVMTLVSKGNMAPVIDQVPDQFINPDAGSQNILLTGIDPVEAGQSITVLNAGSDNTTLIDDPAIATLQPDGSAMLTYLPNTGQSGMATITVTVGDDGSSFPANATSMTFNVMVYDEFNNPPVISMIPDQYHAEDVEGTQTVAVDVHDGDDGTQSLSGTVTTDNAELITGLSYNDATSTIEYTVAPEIFGEATIKLTITDDGGTGNNNGNQSAEAEFKVVVASVNDAPTIDPVEDQTIGLNAAEQTIIIEGLGMGDVYGPDQSLQLSAETGDLSLLTPPTITYEGGNTATLRFSPIRNQLGSTTITVYVMDDGGVLNDGQNSNSITINVEIIPTEVNQPPVMTPFEDMQLDIKNGAVTFDLEGVDDGDENETQTVSITAASSDESVVKAPVVNWVPSLGQGNMKLTPVAEGTATITITLKDNGGTDFGGVDTQEYSFVATVVNTTGRDEQAGKMMQVYPNPASEKMFITLPDENSSYQLMISDMAGKIITNRFVAPGMDLYELDVAGFDEGLYIIRLDSDKATYRSTVIIR